MFISTICMNTLSMKYKIKNLKCDIFTCSFAHISYFAIGTLFLNLKILFETHLDFMSEHLCAIIKHGTYITHFLLKNDIPIAKYELTFVKHLRFKKTSAQLFDKRA